MSSSTPAPGLPASPTLKIRVALMTRAGAANTIGRDCGTVASELLAHHPVAVLDAKWGRPPDEWRATGGGWGRLRLTDWERGYLEAIRTHPDTDQQLLKIIDRLATT